MERRYDAVLFDLDGTLTDTYEGITKSVAYALGQFGIEVRDRSTLKRFIGPPLVDSFRDFYGFSEEDARLAVTHYRTYYTRDGIFDNRVYPGVPELLQCLQQAGIRILLATSKPEVFARQILEHFGLLPYFDFISGALLPRGRDRKAEVVAHALADGGLPAGARPVMVGGGPRPVFVLASLRVMSENYVYMPDRPSVAEASVGRLCDSVRAIRRRVPSACIVVCLHWGVEHTLHPTVMQRHEGRMLVDAGADAVIGHHSHTAQDVEIYRHRPIFYSLGNFIFDLDRPLNRRGLVAKLTVTADSLLVDSLPVEIRKCVPEVVGRVRQPSVGGMGAGR